MVQYHTADGVIESYAPMTCLWIGDSEIKIRDLYDLSGDCFEILETPC